MAKRLTDTEKWNDDWFLSLSNDYRMIWQWLIDNCNHAGVCKRNIRLMNFMCNCQVNEDELIDKMSGRVLIVNDNWFIPKFLKFQYSTLKSQKPVIVSVVKELIKGGYHKFIPESFGNDYIIIEELLNNDYSIIKDKYKDKDKDKDKDTVFKGGMGGNGNMVESGLRFDEKGEKVFFDDGTFQLLGMEQRIACKKNELRPRDVKRGNTY